MPHPSSPWQQFSLRAVFIATALSAVVFQLTRMWGIVFLIGLAAFVVSALALLWYRNAFDPRGKPRPVAGWIVQIAIFLAPFVLVYGLLFPSVRPARETGRPPRCQSRIRQIGVALHSYHDEYLAFPPAFIADENGKPMHSWRVLLLPFLEGHSVYDQYRFDEPWDGPNNSKLHNIRMPVFQCPEGTSRQQSDYVVVVGPETWFQGERVGSLADAQDGTSNTILVIEIAKSDIHWMEPRDLPMDELLAEIEAGNGRAILGAHQAGANVTFGDVHTKLIPHSVDAKTWKAMLTAAGDDNLEEE